MRSTALFSAALLGVLVATPTVAQIWTKSRPSPRPRPLENLAMAYDSNRRVTVLFAGGQYQSVYNETWEFDGVRWSRHPVSPAASPSPRRDHRMVFDSARGVVVLHGGQDANQTLRNDTWEFDGVNWKPVFTPTAPPVRRWFDMAYDAARRRTVLYGGNFTNSVPSETWTYDGRTWTKMLPTPNPGYQDSHQLVYDAARRVTLLLAAPVTPPKPHWEWDGANWRQVSNLPPFFRGHCAAYDGVAKRVVVYDPWTGGTWEWDGQSWIQRTPAQQPNLSKSEMVFDTARGVAVLYGGTRLGAPMDETWTYDSNSFPASTSIYGSACGQPPLTLNALNSDRPLFGAVFSSGITNAPTGTAFVSIGDSRTRWGPFNLPLPLAGYGMPNCWLHHNQISPLLPCVSTGGQTARFDVFIPRIRALLGATFYLQAWAPAPGANPAGYIGSNGLEVILGNL